MKEVRFHGAARAELVSEIQYYAAIDRRLAERLAVSIERATRLAAEFPDMGSQYKYGTRRVFPRRFPYSLVYVVRGEVIYVLAVAPFSRRPGYWRSRMSDG